MSADDISESENNDEMTHYTNIFAEQRRLNSNTILQAKYDAAVLKKKEEFEELKKKEAAESNKKRRCISGDEEEEFDTAVALSISTKKIKTEPEPEIVVDGSGTKNDPFIVDGEAEPEPEVSRPTLAPYLSVVGRSSGGKKPWATRGRWQE